MAKKLMLLPSVRSKFVTDQNMDLIYKTLLVLAGIMILTNYYLYSFMYAVKLLLMVVVAIVFTVEMEILFYSHDKDIDRATSKELIQKSYRKVTALIYVLLIPIGTPLWLVGLGAVLATLLGKLLFGGFHHMVFHTSLVGFMFVTEGWNQLVDGVAFMTSFDNYLLTLIFDRPFFNETLSIGNVFSVEATPALFAFFDGKAYPFIDVLLGFTPGVLASGLVLLIMAVFLTIKKAINITIPVIILIAFSITSLIIGVVTNQDATFTLYHLFSGAFLYVLVFVVTDPITTPVPLKGKIVFGVLVGVIAMFMYNGVNFKTGGLREPLIYATLFMMMLTPMLNEVFKEKKKPIKKPPVKKEAE